MRAARHHLHTPTCACAHTHTHRNTCTGLMSDLPHVDSVMGCGLEHSNTTSGQVWKHKAPLVAVCPSLLAPGTFACHALLCDNESPLSIFFSDHSLISYIQREAFVKFARLFPLWRHVLLVYAWGTGQCRLRPSCAVGDTLRCRLMLHNWSSCFLTHIESAGNTFKFVQMWNSNNPMCDSLVEKLTSCRCTRPVVFACSECVCVCVCGGGGGAVVQISGGDVMWMFVLSGIMYCVPPAALHSSALPGLFVPMFLPGLLTPPRLSRPPSCLNPPQTGSLSRSCCVGGGRGGCHHVGMDITQEVRYGLDFTLRCYLYMLPQSGCDNALPLSWSSWTARERETGGMEV